jgi:hypothetical protein
MGKVVPFRRREIREAFETGFTDILKDAVHVKGKSLGAEVNGIYRLNVNFEDLFKANIGTFIINHRLMDADLFRSGLYVSKLVGEFLSNKGGSYYATDYFIRGIEDNDPFVLQQGGDLCCVFCIFFDERRNWRMMKEKDYMNIGIQLYSLYFAKTRRMIGLSMSRNFEKIVDITKQCVTEIG